MKGLSTLSLSILGLISQRAMSGYDLRKIFSTTPMGHFSSSPGAIYPALERLAKSGLLRGVKDQKRELRPKLVYSLTPEGVKKLKIHLCLPVTQESVMWNLDELILRFAFIEPLLGRNQTLKFLEEFKSQVEAHFKSLQNHLKKTKSDLDPSPILALEHGILSYQMNGRWADRALKQLKA